MQGPQCKGLRSGVCVDVHGMQARMCVGAQACTARTHACLLWVHTALCPWACQSVQPAMQAVGTWLGGGRVCTQSALTLAVVPEGSVARHVLGGAEPGGSM